MALIWKRYKDPVSASKTSVWQRERSNANKGPSFQEAMTEGLTEDSGGTKRVKAT